jgi:hypothetical protein
MIQSILFVHLFFSKNPPFIKSFPFVFCSCVASKDVDGQSRQSTSELGQGYVSSCVCVCLVIVEDKNFLDRVAGQHLLAKVRLVLSNAAFPSSHSLVLTDHNVLGNLVEQSVENNVST